MKLERTKDRIHLDQEKYLSDIIEHFGMDDCKEMVMSIVLKSSTNKEEEEEEVFADTTQYMSLVESLIYLSVVSRPDIAYVVGKVSQKMSCPTQSDWIAAKRILRYLKNNRSMGPLYSIKGSTISRLFGFGLGR